MNTVLTPDESTATRASPVRRIGRAATAIAVLACLTWYVWHARHDLARALRQVDRRYILPMVAVPLLSLVVNGMIGRDLAAEFGVRLSPVEWYGLAVVNSLGNYLPLPQAGAMARGVYLKRVHGLPYTIYAATLAVTYVSAVALYGVLGLIGLAALWMIGRPSPPLLWGLFTALAASVLLFTPIVKLLPMPRRLANLREPLQALRRHHLLLRIILLQTMLVGLTTTGLWLACKTLPDGREVSWGTSLMLGLMILASGIANVTPGNLGVEQGAAAWTGWLLHVPPNVGFLASAIFRAISVVTILAIGPVFGVMLARKDDKRPHS